MIEQQAYVVKLQGEQAIVAMRNNTGCQSCELKGGCGVGSLGKLLGQRERTFAIENRDKLKAGDTIVMGVTENFFVYAGLVMYLLPLISLFGFSLSASFLFNATEWINLVAAVVGLFFGLYLTSRLAKKSFFNGMQPRFIRRQFDLVSTKPVADSVVKPGY